jgi:hypothetical protein
MRFSIIIVLFIVSCTQLPPPVLKGADPTTLSSNDLSGGLAPIVKPLKPGKPRMPDPETKLVMGEEEAGTWKLSLEGQDALTIYRLLAIQPEEAGGVRWKRGRDFACARAKDRSFCEWRLHAPFGRIAELRPLEEVAPEQPEARQSALDTPYIGVPALEWGRKARIKIALGFAERIFESLSATPVFEEGLRRIGEQVNCLKTREAGQGAFQYGCYLRINLSNGTVDKADPDQQD